MPAASMRAQAQLVQNCSPRRTAARPVTILKASASASTTEGWRPYKVCALEGDLDVRTDVWIDSGELVQRLPQLAGYRCTVLARNGPTLERDAWTLPVQAAGDASAGELVADSSERDKDVTRLDDRVDTEVRQRAVRGDAVPRHIGTRR